MSLKSPGMQIVLAALTDTMWILKTYHSINYQVLLAWIRYWLDNCMAVVSHFSILDNTTFNIIVHVYLKMWSISFVYKKVYINILGLNV